MESWTVEIERKDWSSALGSTGVLLGVETNELKRDLASERLGDLNRDGGSGTGLTFVLEDFFEVLSVAGGLQGFFTGATATEDEDEDGFLMRAVEIADRKEGGIFPIFPPLRRRLRRRRFE